MFNVKDPRVRETLNMQFAEMPDRLRNWSFFG